LIPIFTHIRGSITIPFMAIQTRDSIFSVVVSHDDTRIVSSSIAKSVQMWGASTGTELQHLYGHLDFINSVAFSSNDMSIVSGSDDNSV